MANSKQRPKINKNSTPNKDSMDFILITSGPSDRHQHGATDFDQLGD